MEMSGRESAREHAVAQGAPEALGAAKPDVGLLPFGNYFDEAINR
jgi:hypothetical protein